MLCVSHQTGDVSVITTIVTVPGMLTDLEMRYHHDQGGLLPAASAHAS